ncbi:MAG: hypothetical protein VKN72_27345 [Nostocales cyanobacterium 94392]|nr:hypothetical protein [Nostocales cyanobacterium 94392]
MRPNSRISIKLSSWLSIITPLFFFITSAYGIITLQKTDVAKQSQQKNLVDYHQNETTEMQSLQLLRKIPSLGFQNVISDWVYLNFIQYFGDTEVREKIGYGLCPDYFTTLVSKDSKFTNAVIIMDVCTAIFAGEPFESLQKLQLSAKSLQPQMDAVTVRSYYVWRAIGINQLLFQGQPLKAAESYKKAVAFAEKYNDEDSHRFIENMKRSITYLTNNPNSKMAQIGAWVNVLNTNPDPKTLQRVIKEIELLGGKVQKIEAGGFNVKLPPETN